MGRVISIRKQQADETREKLVSLAWEMIRKHGIDSFTVRHLAQKAGVAVGLPYSYFRTRDGLIDELRVRAWDRLEQILQATVGTPEQAAQRGDIETSIRRAMETIVDFALREPHIYELVILRPGMVLSQRVLEREIRTAQRLVQLLYKGQEQGEFRFRGDPTVFALALWTGVQGYVERMGAKTAPMFRNYQEKVLDEMFDVFFAHVRIKGMKTPSS